MKRFFPMHMRVATVMTVLSLFAMFFFAPAAQAQVISPQRSGHTAPLQCFRKLPRVPTRQEEGAGAPTAEMHSGMFTIPPVRATYLLRLSLTAM